ncbi:MULTISPECIES: hypothetical protein [unclassified Vibrio]|uniref:Oxidoreductase n=1 Tax=Vibrio sp. HB236076 TaxID=3232307 RepID=A0AB39HME2_9VIBR|nr:hypothetical protein [Vibrio sp. HB161653]MDP5253303.1 hypothetical protein [Vibrio sp. HB161653]
MSMDKVHVLHSGELALQKRRNTPREVTDKLPEFIDATMPQQHAQFYSELTYLPLTTLDANGRPWVSLLMTQAPSDPSIGITVTSPNQLSVVAEVNKNDPFVRALKQQQADLAQGGGVFAGVGIDFSNRRRNKIAGTIRSVGLYSASKIALELSSDQHLGNCPKYITSRTLEYSKRDDHLLFDHFDSLDMALPDLSKKLIDGASTVFLATKHTLGKQAVKGESHDMGLNHRGGAPGFVRLYEEHQENKISSYLVIPDHSGNRFFQSLGNIETDKQVGLIFPDFHSGDLLYITGDADNVFDQDAEQLMPRVSLLTRIRITGAVHIEGGLNLTMIADEQYSPYNPPVRYLRQELQRLGKLDDRPAQTQSPISATLVSNTALSANVSTFTFQLSKPITLPMPGGFGIFDFSESLNLGYHHMSDDNPQLVNEDYTRTWTLSSAAKYDAQSKQFEPTNQVSITVKRKSGGLMSNVLHQAANHALSTLFKGTGLGFSCFHQSQDGRLTIPDKMLWVAGGVGITPFMAMWDGLVNTCHALPQKAALTTDIVLVFAGSDDEMNLLKPFLQTEPSLAGQVTLNVLGFQGSRSESFEELDTIAELKQAFPTANLNIVSRRLNRKDFEMIHALSDREAFLCGPDSMMTMAATELKTLGMPNEHIHQESYSF